MDTSVLGYLFLNLSNILLLFWSTKAETYLLYTSFENNNVVLDFQIVLLLTILGNVIASYILPLLESRLYERNVYIHLLMIGGIHFLYGKFGGPILEIYVIIFISSLAQSLLFYMTSIYLLTHKTDNFTCTLGTLMSFMSVLKAILIFGVGYVIKIRNDTTRAPFSNKFVSFCVSNIQLVILFIYILLSVIGLLLMKKVFALSPHNKSKKDGEILSPSENEEMPRHTVVKAIELQETLLNLDKHRETKSSKSIVITDKSSFFEPVLIENRNSDVNLDNRISGALILKDQRFTGRYSCRDSKLNLIKEDNDIMSDNEMLPKTNAMSIPDDNLDFLALLSNFRTLNADELTKIHKNMPELNLIKKYVIRKQFIISWFFGLMRNTISIYSIFTFVDLYGKNDYFTKESRWEIWMLLLVGLLQISMALLMNDFYNNSTYAFILVCSISAIVLVMFQEKNFINIFSVVILKAQLVICDVFNVQSLQQTQPSILAVRLLKYHNLNYLMSYGIYFLWYFLKMEQLTITICVVALTIVNGMDLVRNVRQFNYGEEMDFDDISNINQ